ncbi:DUF5691 domain-containing protein [Pendulispora albinea]|uniref:DUF5691 domain-containing protein n=1 Tax=Pendulispora albinea TaxID=2741071 RepID=A0ABZ2M4U6_9BACT
MASTPPAPSSPRAERRRKRVFEGIEALDRWLGDVIRHGLAGLEERPAAFWETQAARLVDAQAPGLAARVRRLARCGADVPLELQRGAPPDSRRTPPDSRRQEDADWPVRLLHELGRVAMLTHAFRRLDALPEPLQADVRQLVGWSLTQEEVLARGEAAADAWMVAGQSITEEDRLRVQRTWLAGMRSGKTALLLQYAAGSAAFAESWVPGTVFEGELVYWPSACPQRALVRTRGEALRPSPPALPGFDRIEAFRTAYARALGCQPWLDRMLAGLLAVTPVHHEGAFLVRDTAGAALPLGMGDVWTLFALSGGAPVDLAAEWDGQSLTPLAVLAAGEYHAPESVPVAASDSPRSGGAQLAAGSPCRRSMDALTRWAVAGTSRQTELTGDADPLAERIVGALDAPLEHRMLLAAGARAVAETAGARALESHHPFPPAEAESRPACSAKAARLLETILRGQHKELLLEALVLLDRAGQRLPHALLPRALNARSEAHRAATRRVMGQRGIWLARMNPAWEWALTSPASKPAFRPRAAAPLAPEDVARLDEVLALDAGELTALVVRLRPQGIGARAFWLSRTLAEIPPSHWTERWTMSAAALVAAAERTDWAAALCEGWTRAALLHGSTEWLRALWDFWQRCDEKVASLSVANAMLVQIVQHLPEAEACACVEPLFGEMAIPSRITLPMALCALSTPWPDAIGARYIEAIRRELGTGSSRMYAIVASLRDASLALSHASVRLACATLDGEGPPPSSHRAFVEFMDVIRIRHELVQEIAP